MIPIRKRIVIALACGITSKPCACGCGCEVYVDRDGDLCHLPDYLHDFNAMAEALKVLNTARLQQTYAELLQKQVRWICFATAEQQADALIQTLGLWEGKP